MIEEPHTGRHLDPITAAMPIVPKQPRHARPDTAELRAQPPRPRPSRDPQPLVSPHSRAEDRKAKHPRPWWKIWGKR